jgi:hypothetical protein
MKTIVVILLAIMIYLAGYVHGRIDAVYIADYQLDVQEGEQK